MSLVLVTAILWSLQRLIAHYHGGYDTVLQSLLTVSKGIIYVLQFSHDRSGNNDRVEIDKQSKAVAIML